MSIFKLVSGGKNGRPARLAIVSRSQASIGRSVPDRHGQANVMEPFLGGPGLIADLRGAIRFLVGGALRASIPRQAGACHVQLHGAKRDRGIDMPCPRHAAAAPGSARWDAGTGAGMKLKLDIDPDIGGLMRPRSPRARVLSRARSAGRGRN
ncbi:hypothetical protein [Phaeovulum sp. NW3]|uniref:hypothetical protein n=1 Tax=Phaeovulum sp. NW3 TaxID=2934933 RepID=UPI0020205977|nr:hypothetical protein [Phaeovulum sp. NW3]MCL7466717.1 hypothetical protein [Phaeovulum sp. NW3]